MCKIYKQNNAKPEYIVPSKLLPVLESFRKFTLCFHRTLSVFLNKEVPSLSLYIYFSKQALNESLVFLQPFIASWTTQNLTDSCQAHLPEQFASNIKLIRQLWHWCCDWQRAKPELHMQNKFLVCSIGCTCSHWLFCFSVLHSNKTVNTMKY